MSPNISRRTINMPEEWEKSVAKHSVSLNTQIEKMSNISHENLQVGTSSTGSGSDMGSSGAGTGRGFTNGITGSSTTSSGIAGIVTAGTTRKFERPKLNLLHSNHPYLPATNHRAASTTSLLNRSPPPLKSKLRRTNSLISQGGSSSSSDNQQQSSTTSSDRFIPSRHNSTSGKLQTDTIIPHPNASPQAHIKAQSSKIYQHHVAEACGLEVNSRVLQYQPLPPERKRPVNLFRNISNADGEVISVTNGSGNSSNGVSSRTILNSVAMLKPAAASARAKKIPTAPERVLDAPGLVDDFYLNLIAWSSTNLLAIGLEDAVYVWNASTGSVGLLCELPKVATSIKWSDDGSYISIGRDDGLLEIWDIETNTKLRTLNCGHQTRIASQAWSKHILTSGSRLGKVYHSDVRVPNHYIYENSSAHSAEICGISYRGDGQQFVTGGNDNLVCIWDARKSHSTNDNCSPLFTKTNHKAAVKALSWCPFQQSLLATGGGSSDKTIHFWNTSTGARVSTIETGSQISSLNWGYAAGIGMEIVATHGFPTNNISIFNYPTLQKTGEILNAHDSRILGGCLSPDSLTLATIAGDENLKFWSLFDAYKAKRRANENEETMSNDEKRMKKMMNIR
ncbi:APC/C activator protein Cdc20p [[Candida] railenensis]|uniref:APC/C activator protein Cdc20p n=1 Tax=[Candida] railenensis TaxID=45579 RepID=A0A9P0QSH2_9ASCO|nr:APC/C activator protein Cdc20p [[Candida] railenensis]